MITWLTSVDISLIYHQIGVFHLKVVEEFVHQPNDLVSETQWSSTIASGNSEFSQQGSQAKPKPLSNFPLLVEMLPIHDIYDTIWEVQNYTWIFCHYSFGFGSDHFFVVGVYFYFAVKHSAFHPATFSYNQNRKKSSTETTHHDMVLSAVYQLDQSNLFVFSQKYIQKKIKVQQTT